MRRVVVTGLGIVSCIGHNQDEVLASLRTGKSGISFQPEYQEMGFKSHIAGSVDIDFASLIDRKLLRFMGDAAAYAYLSMQQAIADAGLTEEQVSNPRTGLIAGSGGASTANVLEAADGMRDKGLRVDPVDAAEGMVQLANHKYSIAARQARFSDIDTTNTYQGV